MTPVLRSVAPTKIFAMLHPVHATNAMGNDQAFMFTLMSIFKVTVQSNVRTTNKLCDKKAATTTHTAPLG